MYRGSCDVWASMMAMNRRLVVGLAAWGGCLVAAEGWQPAEKLDRGLVAIPTGESGAFVSWRLLADDPGDVAFEVFRVTGGNEEKVTDKPLTESTSFMDGQRGEAYVVKAVGGESWKSAVREQPFFDIPIDPPEGYRPGDCSVGDLDGDGQWEIVVHMNGRGRDNGSAGMTDPPVLDAYKLDGTRLWRINLGKNIREGEHYTEFMVWDLDGDGRAEVACKTADGTTDGTGKVIGDSEADWVNKDEGTLKYGRILDGPEFLTVFDGKTGAALATTDFIPGRDPIGGWGGIGGNGGNDSYGNRCDRFLACIAYLDGERPSLVMTRGVYGRIVMAAWDWRDGKLSSRWVFDTGTGLGPRDEVSPFAGMGGHSLSVADVDADGKDEVVFQAMTVDDNGKGLYSTGRRHGDAMHVSDFDPERPGMELYLITENEDDTVRWKTPGAGLHDARTGKPIWTHSPGVDFGDGIVADIDPRHAGAEVWGGRTELRTIKGETIGKAPRFNEWAIWWDGDLLRELYAGYRIWMWDWERAEEKEIFEAEFPFPNRGNRRWGFGGFRPNLTADLIGDWREELLLVGPEGKSLRLYTTDVPTKHRMTCLMQDRQYRESIAWQNVVYNKPPHTSHFIGEPAPSE